MELEMIDIFGFGWCRN